eukprot:766860-Hanusia_phi.AAC.3
MWKEATQAKAYFSLIRSLTFLSELSVTKEKDASSNEKKKWLSVIFNTSGDSESTNTSLNSQSSPRKLMTETPNVEKIIQEEESTAQDNTWDEGGNVISARELSCPATR